MLNLIKYDLMLAIPAVVIAAMLGLFVLGAHA